MMSYINSILKKKIATSTILRKMYYRFLTLTTLTEWYVKREAKEVIGRGDNGFSLLDAGCGFGQYTYYFASRFPDMNITAMDSDNFKIEGLRNFFEKSGLDIHCIHSDLLNINLQNKFDLILCIDVLEHIPQDKRLIELFYAALKSQGRLLIVVPASPQRRICKFLTHTRYGMTPKRFGHVREGYTMEQIKSLLATEGFRIEKGIYSFGTLGSLAYEIFYIAQLRPIFFIIFSPLYFLLVHPILLFLMYLDRLKRHRIGNGIIVIAKKD